MPLGGEIQRSRSRIDEVTIKRICLHMFMADVHVYP